MLLVDEPTKGLAPLLVAEVAEVLDRVSETATILLVEQNLGVVERLARDVDRARPGAGRARGPAKELLADPERVRTLLGVARAEAH